MNHKINVRKGNRHLSNILLSVFATCLFAFSACDTEDEPVPAYLHIAPFQLNATNSSVHGSISHKITNASVFLRDKETGSSHSLGTISLPATLPVLVTGGQEITIDPVIKANGNSYYLQIYPFYERFTTPLDLSANVLDTVKPFTTYKNQSVFVFIEDFESDNHLFKKDWDSNPTTAIQSSDEDVFEGGRSGQILLNKDNSVIVVSTSLPYVIDFASAAKIYMEVNYKTDAQLEFGVVAVDAVGQTNTLFQFIVVPRKEWNKIYFDMTDLIATSGMKAFYFIIRAGLPLQNGQFTQEEAKIYLDNIKLVHF
jgi:hypothetical protein